MTLFDRDLNDSKRRKEEGMERAERHAYEGWKRAFRLEIWNRAATYRPFTSEDVTLTVGLPVGEIRMNANNAVGALMNGAAKRGIIRKTGRHVQSQSPRSHGAELIVWIGK